MSGAGRLGVDGQRQMADVGGQLKSDRVSPRHLEADVLDALTRAALAAGVKIGSGSDPSTGPSGSATPHTVYDSRYYTQPQPVRQRRATRSMGIISSRSQMATAAGTSVDSLTVRQCLARGFPNTRRD